MITLTAREIKDLAEAVGWTVGETYSELDDSDEWVIVECPQAGVRNDDGIIEHYSYVVYCEECPQEGVTPLGEPTSVDAPQPPRAEI